MTRSTLSALGIEMNNEPREPSRIPVRGAVGAVGTVGALALLLSFPGGPLAPGGSVTAADEPLASDEPLATDELITETTTETSGAEAVVEPLAITGDAYETRWGDVQVEITLEGSDITEVVALAMPASDDHTVEISEYVEPILREEAITYDSADVSVISGATYTSEAYALSLQSALDQAGLAESSEIAGEAEVAAEEPAEESVAAESVAAEADGETMTATGDAVAIRWGDVQVAVTVQGDDIIGVETLAIPMDDRKSQRINTSAEPVLREEAITYDTTDVSVVSGATYTSEAYAASLQSALDQLGI
jgi:uncharacterized protein with FMN-binding domain